MRVDSACRLHVVIVDVLVGRHVGGVLVEGIQRVDEVGLVALEHISGHVPLLHDNLVRDAKLVKDEVEYVDIVPGGLALDVDELKGPEVPVADDDQRALLGIAVVSCHGVAK